MTYFTQVMHDDRSKYSIWLLFDDLELNIYTSGVDGLRKYRAYDLNMVAVAPSLGSDVYQSCSWGDEHYIYASDRGGMGYPYEGVVRKYQKVDLSLLSSSSYVPGSSAKDIWGDDYYIYEADNGIPRRINRLNKSDLSYVDYLTVPNGSYCLWGDSEHLYVGGGESSGAEGIIFKISLETFTIVDSVTLSPNGNPVSIVGDNNFLYIGIRDRHSPSCYVSKYWKTGLQYITSSTNAITANQLYSINVSLTGFDTYVILARDNVLHLYNSTDLSLVGSGTTFGQHYVGTLCSDNRFGYSYCYVGSGWDKGLYKYKIFPDMLPTHLTNNVFVRDKEIQAVILGDAYRSPDFGDNWYKSEIPSKVFSIGFDVNNYQNSVVGDSWQLHVFDKELNNVYYYTEGDTVSGVSLDIDCDLKSNVTLVGTDSALYKTLKYGVGGTRVFLNEPVTSVAIGGSYVSNPFFSFAPEELNDAHLYSTDSSYSTARLASNGQLLHDDYAKIGQSKVDSTYSVDRFGLVFDTSLLPDNPIISAMIRLYVIELRADIEFSVYVQGSNDYPSVPIIVGDYNYSLYTGNCGYVNSDSIQEGRYLTINLNSSGLNLINKEGYSRFIIRTNRDINGNEPTGREFIRVNQREKGGHQTPKLFVTIRKEN